MNRIFGTALFLSLVALIVPPVAAQPSHGIAMHGDLKYSANFKHFEYVNPNSPKGGEVKRAATGGFDTFNPYVIKGRTAAGIGHLFETLMTSSADEAFSEYGLLAETVEISRPPVGSLGLLMAMGPGFCSEMVLLEW